MLREDLPALSSPNPDGRELEVLDMYIERYDSLAAGGEGVSVAASTAMSKFADAFRGVRRRLEAGESLPDVLAAMVGDPDSELVVAGTVASEQGAMVCP